MENILQLLNLRKEKMAQAEEFLNQSKIEEANQLMEEVKNLDTKISLLKNAEANLNSLKGALDPSIILGKNAIPTIMENEDNVFATNQYREAFRNALVKNDFNSLNTFFNKDETTKTTEATGFVLPPQLFGKILFKLKKCGNILAKVVQTNFPAGVEIPKAAFNITASWVAEGTKQDRKKVENSTPIVFKWNKLATRISLTYEMSIVSLEDFEDALAVAIANAMSYQLENSILVGDGAGKPKGILKETIGDTQKVKVAKATDITLQHLIDMEGLLPLEYEQNASWVMTKKTFLHCKSLKDNQGRPIGTFEMGANGYREAVLLGREVLLNSHMKNHTDTLTAPENVIGLFDFNDYAVNFNAQLTIRDYYDEDLDEKIKKGLMLADGKALDTASLVVLEKSNA